MHSATLSRSFSDPVADLHNHPCNTPPSSGDVYALISNQNSYANYSTRYVITPNGTTYALVVTDKIAMNIFLKNYPPYQANPNMSPNFSGAAWDTFEQMNFDGYSDETILSEILDKHNSGIALTKMDSNGNLKKNTVNQTNTNGTISYILSNCP